MVRTGKPDRKVIENAQAALVEEGTKLRTQVLGEKHVTTLGEAPAFLQPIRNMAAAGGWAMCWTRPGLELKTRSLLCIVMLSVLGKDHELAVHVRGAVQNGCAVTEIREALFQVSVYAGVPCAFHATRVAWKTLEGMGLGGDMEGVEGPSASS